MRKCAFLLLGHSVVGTHIPTAPFTNLKHDLNNGGIREGLSDVPKKLVYSPEPQALLNGSLLLDYEDCQSAFV